MIQPGWAYRLRVLASPDEAAVGRCQVLGAGAAPTVVGRSPGPGGLGLEDSRLSRRHVAVWVLADGNTLKVEDLGSRNGTTLDRSGLSEARTVWSQDGLLLVGDSLLHVGWDVSSEAPGRATLDPLLRHALAGLGRDVAPVGLLAARGAGARTLARELHRRADRQGPLVLMEREYWDPERPEEACPEEPGATVLLQGADRVSQTGLKRLATASRRHSVALVLASREGLGAIEAVVAPARVVLLPRLETRRASIWGVTRAALAAAHGPDLSRGAWAVWLNAPMVDGWGTITARIEALTASLGTGRASSEAVRRLLPARVAPASEGSRRRRNMVIPGPEELRALLATHGGVSATARALGRPRITIYRWMRRYGLES